MKWTALILATLGLVLLQTSAAPAFELFGVAPNLLLVALCAWTVVRGNQEALVLIPVAGLGIGLLSFQGIPESIAAFVPIGLVAALRPFLQPRIEFFWALAVTAAATILHFLAIALAVQIQGSSIDWFAAATDILVPSVLVNLLLGAAVYWLVRLPVDRVERMAA